MQDSYYSSIFSMYAQVTEAISGANKQKNIISNPDFGRVGIKFVIISPGKLIRGTILKKIFTDRDRR